LRSFQAQLLRVYNVRTVYTYTRAGLCALGVRYRFLQSGLDAVECLADGSISQTVIHQFFH
jgi:hypothetical protein